MKVSKITGTDRAGPGRRSRRTADGGEGFSAVLDGLEAKAGADPATESGAATPLSALLAVQEVEAAGDATGGGPRRALERGGALLDRLEQLRLDILAGQIAPDRLEMISALARTRREAGCPPVVADLLDAIELRAEVEIAKWRRSAAP